MYGALYYIAIVLLRCSHFPLFLFFPLLSIWSILRGWNDPLVISFAMSCSNETVSVVFIFDSIRRTKAAFPFFFPFVERSGSLFQNVENDHVSRSEKICQSTNVSRGGRNNMEDVGVRQLLEIVRRERSYVTLETFLTRENFSIWRPRARLFILVSVSRFRSPRW